MYISQPESACPPKASCKKNCCKLVEEILAEDELTDEHITFANALLRQQFPSIGGFQSILLSQNNGFHPVKSECNYIT